MSAAEISIVIGAFVTGLLAIITGVTTAIVTIRTKTSVAENKKAIEVVHTIVNGRAAAQEENTTRLERRIETMQVAALAKADERVAVAEGVAARNPSAVLTAAAPPMGSPEVPLVVKVAED